MDGKEVCPEGGHECPCKGWTIGYRCPEFWDVAANFAAEFGLIIDDAGNLLDQALKDGLDLMKYFWWVLIGFAVLVALVLAIKLFQALGGRGKSKKSSKTITITEWPQSRANLKCMAINKNAQYGICRIQTRSR